MSQLPSASFRSAVRYCNDHHSLNTVSGLCTSSSVNAAINSTAHTIVTGIGSSTGEVDDSVPLTNGMDVTCGVECSERMTVIDAAEDENMEEPPDVFFTPPNSQGEKLFMNRTNDNCIKYGRKRALTTPVDTNTSYQNSPPPPQPQRCSTLHSGNEPSSARIGNEPLPNGRYRPPSFIVSGEVPIGSSRTDILREENVGHASGRRWILTGDPGSHGEAGGEPVLLSTVIDRGWGKLCEEEAAWWKHRCVMTEEQLAVALKRVNECCGVTAMTPSLPPSSELGTSATQEKDATLAHSPLLSELELENKRLQTLLAQFQERGVSTQEGGRRSAVVHRTRDKDAREKSDIDALIGRADKEVQCMVDEKYQELQESVKLLRSERDTLANELHGEVIKRENLEASLRAKEEHQVSQREEWLSKEAILKKKQELLATSLRQAHLNASAMSEEVEVKEGKLQEAQSQILALEAELSVSKAEVIRLQETGKKSLEEGQQLQEQLRELEADLYLHVDITKENIYEKDGSSLNGSLQQYTKGLLLRVVAAMRCVESDEKWIASQIVQLLNDIGVTGLSKKTESSSECVGCLELRQLVHLVETLITYNAKLLEENSVSWLSAADTIWKETYSTLSTTALNATGHTDILAPVQDCLSQLERGVNAQKQRYLELKEELEVVRTDRNELVGQQSKQVLHLQKLLLVAEEEKAHLILDIEERDMIRRLNEESLLSASLKYSSSAVEHSSASELQETKKRPIVVQKVYNNYLERILVYVNRQVEEFYHALHARMMMAVESFEQLRSEESAHMQRRASALQAQLQRLREERDANQRVQDECLAALRTQLTAVRAELAEKENTQRIAPTARINQDNNYRHQRSSSSSSFMMLCEERTMTPEASLRSLSSPHCPSVTIPALSRELPLPPPPLTQERRQYQEQQPRHDQHHEDKYPAKPSGEQRNAVSAHSHGYNPKSDDAVWNCFAGKSAPLRRSVTFGPTVIVEQHQQQEDGQEQERRNKCEQFEQQADSFYGAFASRSSSSSYSSNSPSMATRKEVQASFQGVRWGVMRKHQELWLRQAEVMGIPVDGCEHKATTQRTLFMQLPTP